jgi:SAM-dependent methyltransferase
MNNLFKSTLGRVGNAAGLVGFDARRLMLFARNTPRFVRDAYAYRAQQSDSQFRFSIFALQPQLSDFQSGAGTLSGHYFWQDLWAAKKVFASQPEQHVDVGSRLDGFIAHVLTFMPVTVVDIRPPESGVEGLTFVQADATDLATFPSDSVESLSSLHAVEHFGLGRYGDPINPEGWSRAMQALQRVLRPGGKLYFSVPVGRERLVFNSHRVFAPETVVTNFSHLTLQSFAAVDDQGRLVEEIAPEECRKFRCGCGLFEFTKK